MNLEILFLSVGVGASIGYITNFIAIKMLFRPYKPIKLGNFTLFPQGVIPREKALLAKKVAEVVESYILSEEEIKKIITSNKVKEEVEDFIENKIKELTNKDITEFLTKEELAEKFSKIIVKVVEEKFPMFARLVNEEMIKTIMLKLEIPLKIEEIIDTQKVLPKIKEEIFKFLEEEVPKIFIKANIKGIIEEKIVSFDEKTLEEMLFVLMKKHFSFINFAGAVLGGIIGIIQYLVIAW